MRSKKRITAPQAAKILGCTPENVRLLAKNGILSTVTVNNGNHSTAYYFESEVKARKDACSEVLTLALSTGKALEQARRASAEGEEARRQALGLMKTYERWPMYCRMFSDLLVSTLDVLGREENHSVGFRYALAEDIAALKPWDEIKRKYNLTDITLRHWLNRVGWKLRRINDIGEKNACLREQVKTLREENELLGRKISRLEALVKEQADAESKTIITEDGVVTLDAEGQKVRKALLTPISELFLSVRAFNGCRSLDISTVGDLVFLRRQDVIKTRNIGRKTMNELDLAVERLNLCFDMDITRYGVYPPTTKWYPRHPGQ